MKCNHSFRKTQSLMLVFLRSPGGNQLARAATLLSCLQFGAALLFMTVRDRMFQRQCLGFSGAKLRSKPCRFGWDRRLPAQGGWLQCSGATWEGSLWRWASAPPLPPSLPDFRAQELLRPSMLALTLLPFQSFSLSAVTVGCSISCL